MASTDFKKGANYHRLADLMRKGQDLAIFRRFNDLNIMCLLSLQAEILSLEEQYNDQCDKDEKKTGPDEVEYATYFQSLHKSREDKALQVALLDKLQTKLGTYNNLLIQVHQLSRAENPQKASLRELQNWLRDSKGGKNFLDGVECFTWADTDVNRYVAIGPPLPEMDGFTSLMRNWIFGAFHFLFSEKIKFGTEIDEESGMRSYSDSHMNKAASMVTVIMSSILPVLTIFALNAAETLKLRIGLVAIFTGTFAAILAFTSARRVEIFAATATFAAIEVVYIGTALGSDK